MSATDSPALGEDATYDGDVVGAADFLGRSARALFTGEVAAIFAARARMSATDSPCCVGMAAVTGGIFSITPAGGRAEGLSAAMAAARARISATSLPPENFEAAYGADDVCVELEGL